MPCTMQEGFDWSPSLSSLLGAFRFWRFGNGSSMATMAGRFDGRCAQPTNGSGGLARNIPDPTEYFSLGFAVMSSGNITTVLNKIASFGPTDFGGNHNGHLCFNVTALGACQVGRSSGTGTTSFTPLITGPVGAMIEDQWLWISMWGRIHDTLGEIGLAVNDVVIADLTGQDTLNSGSGSGVAEIGQWEISSSNTNNVWHDDIVFYNENIGPIEDTRVSLLNPNADGGVVTLTPSTGATAFGVVDEGLISATDYLQGTAAGDKARLLLPSLPFTPSVIHAARVLQSQAKTDAAARSAYIGLYDGVTADQGIAIPLTASPTVEERHMYENPFTSAGWTMADIDNLQLVPEIAV